MALDRNAFIQSFLDEARENVAAMESGIVQLRNDPGNLDVLTAFLRQVHTLKGSARMLKFPLLEKLTHSLEDVFRGIKEGRFALGTPLVQLVLASCTHLRRSLDRIEETRSDDNDPQSLLDACRHAASGEPFVLETDSGPAPSLAATGEGPGNAASSPLLPEGESPAPGLAREQGETIRVHTRRVDALLQMHNDLIIKQFQLKRELDTLGDLESRMREYAHRQDASAQGNADMREIMSGLSMLAETRKGFSNRFQAMEQSALQVQKGLLSLLMLPVELILGPMPGMVESLAGRLGKEVDLTMTGTTLGMDRAILERIKDPVIHLVRNALDHGLETIEERTAAGKPARGCLDIHCSTDSSSFVMRIQDDGRGLDYGKIRKKALAFRPEIAETIETMEPQALTQFLFEPGFSTRDEATDLSGRGLGLDIVRHGIEEVKGKLNLESTPGAGTSFTLTLPLSLATVNGFFVNVNGRRYLLPGNYIQEVLVLDNRNLLHIMNRNGYLVRDRILPIHHLGDLLPGTAPTQASSRHGMVIDLMGESLIISVDSIEQYASLVYKPLPPSLSGIRALQGFVFDENFDIITILSIPDLMDRFRRSGNFEGRKRFSGDRPEYQRILVVDDSFSTREIEKSILEFEGFSVETAVDGIEALEILKARNFHLVVTDLNMPRMDGVTLVQNLKRDERYRDLPVIVVSSEKDREKKLTLQGLGACSYIDKADFDRGDLATEVHRLLAESRGGGKDNNP